MRSRSKVMRLSLWPFANPPIGQAFSRNLAQRGIGTLGIGDALGRAMRKAEVKLVDVARQMRFADVVIGAEQPALEKPEVGLDGVAVNVTASVFARKVIHHRMFLKRALGHVFVMAGRIREKLAVLRNVRLEKRNDSFAVNPGDGERARFTFPRNERNDLVLMLRATLGIAATFDFAVVGFVGLDNRAAASERSATIRLHGLTDAMRHEPRRFVGDPEHTVQLVAAHALLAGNQQVRRQKPFVERDMATLVDRANCHREVFAALIALVQAWAMRFTLKACDVLYRSAMRTDWAIGPAHRLKVLAGFGFVCEDWIGKIGGHGVSPV